MASRHIPPNSPATWLAAIATASLFIGSLVYLTDRAPETVYLVPAGWSWAGRLSLFGWLGGVLPDFLHVYAFSLLTAAVLGATALHFVVGGRLPV